MKALKKKKASSPSENAPDRLNAAVSLMPRSAHVITADITTTILELLSQHHQSEVNMGGKKLRKLKKDERVSIASLYSTM